MGPDWHDVLLREGASKSTCAEMLSYIREEMAAIRFSEEERRELTESKLSHRLFLRGGWQTTYARDYYGGMIAKAVKDLFPRGIAGCRVLEVGCGTGTQTILFSILGAHATGLDMNPVRLGIAAKRANLYRTAFRDWKAAASFEECDALDYAPRDGKLFAAVYSMFALNLIQPTSDIIRRIRDWMAPGGRLVIDDGNYAYLPLRLLRRGASILHPEQIAAMLESAGYVIHELSYCGVLPPVAWTAPAIARWGNRALEYGGRGFRSFGRAYHLVAERR